jgi:hypothetical protein
MSNSFGNTLHSNQVIEQIYRLYVVWSDTRYAKPIIILPVLTLMGTAGKLSAGLSHPTGPRSLQVHISINHSLGLGVLKIEARRHLICSCNQPDGTSGVQFTTYHQRLYHHWHCVEG